MGKSAKFKFGKLDKAFYRSSTFAEIVRLGAAAFRPRLSGGFGRLIDKDQGRWADLHPAYLEQKKRGGLDKRKWVRTGRTLKALSQGPLKPKEGTQKGVRFKFTPGRLIATIMTVTFGRRGKRPTRDVQKKIFKNLNYGIDSGKKSAKPIRSKSGRDLRGFPARRLFDWERGEMEELRKSLEVEIDAIFHDAGM